MGLDIVYFTNGQSIEMPKHIEDVAAWANANGAIQFYTLEGLEERLTGLRPGWVTGAFAGGFRAGSYSGYNAWRDRLSQAVLKVSAGQVWQNPEGFVDEPFAELINFADNEGCIGPVTCEKLAQDFAAHRETFERADNVSEYDLERYDNWSLAFKTAGGNGFVVFV